jgi:hypothetical protein
MAKGAAVRSKRIAFGDGRRIIWGPYSAEIFRGNPNIAPPGSERNNDIEWRHYCKGHRLYNRLADDRWIWNYDFKARPGEFFFDARERSHTIKVRDAVLIEPNVPWHKSVAVNKDWGIERYQQLADLFKQRGFVVFQLSYGTKRLRGVEIVRAPDFRCAVAAAAGAWLRMASESDRRDCRSLRLAAGMCALPRRARSHNRRGGLRLWPAIT